jgi:hypothetical protein
LIACLIDDGNQRLKLEVGRVMGVQEKWSGRRERRKSVGFEFNFPIYVLMELLCNWIGLTKLIWFSLINQLISNLSSKNTLLINIPLLIKFGMLHTKPAKEIS